MQFFYQIHAPSLTTTKTPIFTPSLPPTQAFRIRGSGAAEDKNVKLSRDDDRLGGQTSVGAVLSSLAMLISSDRKAGQVGDLSDGRSLPGGHLQGRLISLSRRS